MNNKFNKQIATHPFKAASTQKRHQLPMLKEFQTSNTNGKSIPS